MTAVVDHDVDQITQVVWDSLLGVEVYRTFAAEPIAHDQQPLTGCVLISGAFEGAVTLSCTHALAANATATMLDTPLDEVHPEEVVDALGELTNMIGGNIKALLPEPSRLSIPAVVEGDHYTLRLSGTTVVQQVTFECDGEPLIVTVFEKKADPTAPAATTAQPVPTNAD